MFTTSIMFITNISYLLQMTKKNKSSNPKKLAIAGFFAIFIALLFMISSVPAQAGIDHSQQETGFTTTVNYIPNPLLNSNVTWSTFNSTWAQLEYSNGQQEGNLTAHLNPQYANPITVNASKIQTSAFNEKIDTTWWNNSADWYTVGASNGQINSVSSATVNGKPAISIEMNATSKAGNQIISTLPITWTELPSQNLAYDYATITGYAYGTTTPLNDRITLMNQTTFGNDAYTNTIGIINETPYGEQPDYSIQNGQSFFASFPLNMPNVSMQKSTGISIGIIANTPAETSTLMHIMITGISITEYPLALGQTNMGGSHQATGYIGKAKLSTLDPSFAWKTITNNGYSVAVTQELQNTTISQTSINNGIYTEEATYQGILKLPSEPDLSYTNSYISLQMNLTGKQFIVTNLNGISYSSQIQAKTNGTFSFGTVNPNNQNTVIIEVEYTSAQWTSSSGVPSFWTIQGIEYYWYIFLGGALGLIGLGTGLSKHAETLRVGKK